MEERLQRVLASGSIAQPGPVDAEAARELIRARDRETAGYLRYLFNVDYLDPKLYDITLNTARWNASTVVDYLSDLLSLPEVSKTADSIQRLENLALGSLVEASLVNNAGIWVHGLKVTADQGEITITGEVITDEDRDIAEEIAAGVSGVRGIVNELRIQPPPLTGM
jgi:hypothetical protein